jgi:ParB-like chromosome segregation protein Spo0J
LAADLRYPLDGYVAAGGRLTILDGVHRLLKAKVEGHSTVRVRVLETDAFDAIAVPAPE